MKTHHILYLIGGFIVAATAANFVVANVGTLNQSKTVTSANALLQKVNPLYYVGLVSVPGIPAT